MIDILAPVALLSIVLLGIHAYFGMEIIKRGIIFTDLAIGQMAALGAAISLLLFDGQGIYLMSLGCAVVGGLLIAFMPQRPGMSEAFIGLLYAFGISGVFMLLSKSPHGMEEFQHLMAADILFTPISSIWHAAAVYLCLGGVIIFGVRRTSGRLKDILFFLTFALTVTSSVRLAGVLVVFAILIGPAVIAYQVASRWRLGVAWGVGTLINLAAIAASYFFDLPTGYALVFVHAACAMAVSIVRGLKWPDEAG